MNALIKILHLLPPEAAHNTTLAMLKTRLAPNCAGHDDPVLRTTLWGKTFSNPVGLAAGFDKNAEVPLEFFKLGFGFAETGTVTPRPQNGNPAPRLFRWPHAHAVINRMGFNNKGLDYYCANLAAIAHDPLRSKAVVGGNIGRNKDSTDAVADYVNGLEAVAPYVDYITINISSPNTPGLRGLQNREELTTLLQALVTKRAGLAIKPPLLVKIAPDLDEAACDAIAEVVMNAGVDGLIISNTTIARPTTMPPELAREAGGLSGPPVFAASNSVLERIARLTRGKIPLIGVGGIASAADAYKKIRLGASLVQLYTGLVYEGPALVWQIKKGLAEMLKRDGFVQVADAVGADIKP